MKASLKHTLNATALSLAVAATLAGLPSPAHAADMAPSPPEATDPLATARARIAGKKWGAASDELKRVNARNWNVGAETVNNKRTQRKPDAALQVFGFGKRPEIQVCRKLFGC